ncbi:diacylglycerol kinase family protein [Patescibacteria group bacterium]|nr:diacylglycerol kinase family protein [Patescibacteria group bacterium]
MINPKKLSKSFIHAYHGLIYLLKHEQNFKIHLLFGILALTLGLVLHITYYELLILLLLIAFVFMAEIVNTVIENILDLLHPEKHHQIKNIKDATAGVVLFASFVAIIIGIIIFLPKLI